MEQAGQKKPRIPQAMQQGVKSISGPITQGQFSTLLLEADVP